MIKKKIGVCLIAFLTLGLTSCLNEQDSVGVTKNNYKYIHIQLNANNSIIHDKIISYTYEKNNSLVQIETENYGWICMNDGFMLYNSINCPICNR